MKKPVAKYWEREDSKIICKLCPKGCVIAPGKRGFCRIRENIGGILYASGYGEVVSIANDPIEKKPLYHFYPGSYIISLACNGCNLACPHCQNWEISQMDFPTKYISPEELILITKKAKSPGICFTYTEPLIWFEYIIDVGKLAKEEGLYIVLVTNGQINPEPLKEIIPFVDAMNIDLKAMDEKFYKEYVKGDLETTLNTIKTAYKNGVHIEVTNLIIPTMNDTPEQIKRLVDFIADIDPEIPVHFTRFFPHYKVTHLPPTPVETLLEAKRIADEKLKFVYVGNVADIELNTTFCPDCKTPLIVRSGFHSVKSTMKKDRCPKCNRKIYGRF